ncbi:hypothetical protein K3169_03240 [Pseudomonas phytophila]|uniref:Lipoprotein n=1 Tax=Pseudomonas phytophila TaxID=2867264 RepID=A0ABY6FGC8_9PSED|nr:hypothetical protein [Pseudomonas phytophila]UXZ96942.1 hypothetical protein K3169_03240 [Pseudomonas phytophila]
MTIKARSAALLLICLLLHGCVSNLFTPADDRQTTVPAGQIHPLALDLPPATMTEAPNGELVLDNLGANANVTFTYPAIADTHTAGLRWTGKTTYNAPHKTVGAARPVAFTIPKTTLELDSGETGVVTYTVGVGDNPIEYSRQLSIRVIGTPAPNPDYPPPTVPSAPNGKLDLATAGETVTITATYPSITNGHTVGMRWTGKAIYDIRPVQTVGATRPLAFAMPKAEIAKDLGTQGYFTYSVGVDGNPLKISERLPIEVINRPPPDGAAIAEAINTRYGNTATSCAGNTPSFYCNGVIIRSTQNGNYDPWNPANSAITLGGVSFTYMRADAGVTNLYHHSGFIFAAQADAIAANKAMEYLCIYSSDAGTLSAGRKDKGCGIRTRSISEADLSSCTAVNVRTLEQWVTYSTPLTAPSYQCSLSAQDAAQFQVSVEARAYTALSVWRQWNEIMVTTWPQDTGDKLPLEAFFWKTNVPASLEEAKTYQTKFKTKTGLWVPVIRLDFTQVNAKPFSYDAGDQAVQP